MKSKMFCIAILMSCAAISGCHEESAEKPLATSASNIPVEPLTVSQAVSFEPPSPLAPSTEVVQPKHLEAVDRDTNLIQEDENFFAQPNLTAMKQVVQPETGKEQEAVRLIGFIKLTAQEDDSRRAIIKVGNESVLAKQGDTFHNMELLEMTERSVTLQRDRQRWTLSLFNQPVVNQETPAFPNTSDSRRGSRNRSQDSSRQPTAPLDLKIPPPPPLPPTPIQPPAVPSMPEIEMPELPPLPDQLKLPDLK